MMGKRAKHEMEKMLDVDASMQGSLVFKDPVSLRINGRFEGTLNTKGNLMISEHAVVNADIIGESIVIAGKVNGHVHAQRELKLIAPAMVVGDIKTPLLSVADNSSRRRLAIVRVSGSALSFGNDWSSASITCAWVASDTDCAT